MQATTSSWGGSSRPQADCTSLTMASVVRVPSHSSKTRLAVKFSSCTRTIVWCSTSPPSASWTWTPSARAGRATLTDAKLYPMNSRPTALSYNKVCNVEDFSHVDLRETIRDVFDHERRRFGDDFPTGREYRKYWEVAMTVRTLRDHGLLDGTRELLGVGAGNEATIFYLTRFARRVFATDLYLASENHWSEADVSMLVDPGRHWPFSWEPRRLVVQHMDGRDLRFEDESFDGVFSSSSIEHFGTWADVHRSAAEMFRVLKPGGLLTLSTELCVEGPSSRWDCGGGTLLMDPVAINDVIVAGHDWELVSPLDLYLSDPTLATDQDHGAALEHQERQVAEHGAYFTFRIEHLRYPHIVLSWRGYSWTSVHLALRKGSGRRAQT